MRKSLRLMCVPGDDLVYLGIVLPVFCDTGTTIDAFLPHIIQPTHECRK